MAEIRREAGVLPCDLAGGGPAVCVGGGGEGEIPDADAGRSRTNAPFLMAKCYTAETDSRKEGRKGLIFFLCSYFPH